MSYLTQRDDFGVFLIHFQTGVQLLKHSMVSFKSENDKASHGNAVMSSANITNLISLPFTWIPFICLLFRMLIASNSRAIKKKVR